MADLLVASMLTATRFGLNHFGRMLNWMLIVVVLIVAIIGFLFITRGTAVRSGRAGRWLPAASILQPLDNPEPGPYPGRSDRQRNWLDRGLRLRRQVAG